MIPLFPVFPFRFTFVPRSWDSKLKHCNLCSLHISMPSYGRDDVVLMIAPHISNRETAAMNRSR